MAKVTCPNKQYSGVSAGVTFVNGLGETEDINLIAWFKEKGYTVEESQEEIKLEDMTVNDLKAYAGEKDIDISKARVKADIIKTILEAEAGAEPEGNKEPEGEPEEPAGTETGKTE